jgi:hypothetical protein
LRRQERHRFADDGTMGTPQSAHSTMPACGTCGASSMAAARRGADEARKVRAVLSCRGTWLAVADASALVERGGEGGGRVHKTPTRLPLTFAFVRAPATFWPRSAACAARAAARGQNPWAARVTCRRGGWRAVGGTPHDETRRLHVASCHPKHTRASGRRSRCTHSRGRELNLARGAIGAELSRAPAREMPTSCSSTRQAGGRSTCRRALLAGTRVSGTAGGRHLAAPSPRRKGG